MAQQGSQYASRRKQTRHQTPKADYSVRETAKLLGVVYDVVLRYLRDGKLYGRKVAVKGLKKEWRIPHRELERFRRQMAGQART